ncbi:MAG: DoxX family protein [Phycisphaerae bacterium]|nr:DoxX family protein [Phycisphaerae bacterium]
MLWSGRALTFLIVAMLTFSAAMKFSMIEDVTKEFTRLGYQQNVIVAIGITELACAVVYVIPQTAILGAILLTGYLGGAIATHVRVGDYFIGPAIGGVLVWLAIFLREPRLRRLIPFRNA